MASEKNRLHKTLDDGGIRLGTIVTDIHGVSARGIIKGLIEGQSLAQLLSHVHGRLRKKIPDLEQVLTATLSERHLYCITTYPV